MMRRRIVLLVVPPVDELDLVGPVEVFGTANRLLSGRKPYAVEVVTTARDRRVDGESGLSLLADRHYADVDGRPDSVSFRLRPRDLACDRPRSAIRWSLSDEKYRGPRASPRPRTAG